MTKGKITKKEKTALVKGILLAGGVWFIVAPMRDFISINFPGPISYLLGAGLIYFALKRY